VPLASLAIATPSRPAQTRQQFILLSQLVACDVPAHCCPCCCCCCFCPHYCGTCLLQVPAPSVSGYGATRRAATHLLPPHRQARCDSQRAAAFQKLKLAVAYLAAATTTTMLFWHSGDGSCSTMWCMMHCTLAAFCCMVFGSDVGVHTARPGTTGRCI
jgi:hypothetical protein